MKTSSSKKSLGQPSRLAEVASVIRAGRKLRGYNQSELAKAIGVSQSWISKMEAGVSMPSAQEWFDLCHFLNIDSEETFRGGYIDLCHSVVQGPLYPDSTLKIPAKYKQNAASKVRAVRPLLKFFSRRFGEEKLDEFLRSEGFDPDFFLVLDNQFNLSFLIKLLGELRKAGHLNRNGMNELGSIARQPYIHGGLRRIYDKSVSPKQLLIDLLERAPFYEANFNYAIQDQSSEGLVFSVSPEEHLSTINLREDGLEDLLCRYKRTYFQQFAQYGTTTAEIELKDHECLFRGDNRCVYEVKTA